MKVIKQGYDYEVGDGQVIRFMGGGNPEGATTEELVAVLRDRFAEQHRNVPGRHTGPVIQLLDKVSAYLAAREGQRSAAGLTGSDKPHDPIAKV